MLLLPSSKKESKRRIDQLLSWLALHQSYLCIYKWNNVGMKPIVPKMYNPMGTIARTIAFFDYHEAPQRFIVGSNIKNREATAVAGDASRILTCNS